MDVIQASQQLCIGFAFGIAFKFLVPKSEQAKQSWGSQNTSLMILITLKKNHGTALTALAQLMTLTMLMKLIELLTLTTLMLVTRETHDTRNTHDTYESWHSRQSRHTQHSQQSLHSWNLKHSLLHSFNVFRKWPPMFLAKGFVVVSRGKWSLSIATLFTEMGHLGLLGHIVASLLIREINPTEPAFDSNITSKLSCDFKL